MNLHTEVAQRHIEKVLRNLQIMLVGNGSRSHTAFGDLRHRVIVAVTAGDHLLFGQVDEGAWKQQVTFGILKASTAR